MKAKTARRWLVRNQVKVINNRDDNTSITRHAKTCKRVLRKDAKTNKDSRRVFNQLYNTKAYQ